VRKRKEVKWAVTSVIVVVSRQRLRRRATRGKLGSTAVGVVRGESSRMATVHRWRVPASRAQETDHSERLRLAVLTE